MLAENLRHLRKLRGLSQSQMASFYYVSRQAWASYEEGRAEPKLFLLQKLSADFGYSIDSLVGTNIATGLPSIDVKAKNLRVLTVAVDNSQLEVIPVVPQKAAAGYANGYGDSEYISNLHHITLNVPELKGSGSRRLFQIKGDSMLPLPSGAYIICHYMRNWEELKEGNCYIFVTRDDGILYKRLSKNTGHQVHLKSDNPSFKDQNIRFEDVLEIWQADGYIALELPGEGDYVPGLSELKLEINQLRNEIRNLAI